MAMLADQIDGAPRDQRSQLDGRLALVRDRIGACVLSKHLPFP
jgi:hypothetical protein